MTATLTPFKGMVVEGQLSYKDRNQTISTFRNEMNPLINFLTGNPITGSEVTPNSYEETWRKTNSYTAQLYASYEKDINKHYFKLLVGTSYEDNNFREVYAKRRNMLSNGMGNINAGSSADGDVFNSGYSTADAFQSFFSRLIL
ncbi:hypothetical protein [Elizabethkingia sp. JS20170427COW]|uniref:hypothetical protein n=1 Tax=Elizabethkingia sp. JS20170427COW TaxID=2583851 RepID=UPI001110E640|nr:hypothetical protein [Elizabethkingia sp. JS20170427COW]QCX52936.1 hypothetical protein FGE20_03865 [Elizabethkingia sp. JS20170427COW]